MKKYLIAPAVVAALATPAVAVERQIGSWNVLEQKDPITDQPRILASIESKSDAAVFGFRCERGRAMMHLQIRYRYQASDRIAVILRVDDNEPIIAEWTPQLGSGIAWVGVSQSTYKAIATAKRISLQLTLRSQHTNGSAVLVFPAVKTAEALRPVIAACPIEAAVQARGARPFHECDPIFEEASDLIEQWKALNESCRGGAGDDEKTNKACEERLIVEKKLGVQGCKFNHSGEWSCKQ